MDEVNVTVAFVTATRGGCCSEAAVLPASIVMRVVTLHKRRLLAVAMSFVAMFALLLLAVVSSLQQEQQMSHGRTLLYRSDEVDASNDSVWRYDAIAGSNYGGLRSSNDTLDADGETGEGILGEYDDGNDEVREYDDDGDKEDGENGSEEDEADDEEEEDNENEVFRDGDFDAVERNSTSTTAAISMEGRTSSFNLIPESKIGDRRKLHADVVDSRVKRGARRRGRQTPVQDRLFWSRELEASSPEALSDDRARDYRQRARRLRIDRLTPPTWNRCGRANNQYVTFEDGSHACARHRSPHDYLVQGEVLCFYLARLLGIHNVPAVVLSRVNPDADQWNSPSKGRSGRAMIAEAHWQPNTTVALIQWIDGLQRDRMPLAVFNALKSGTPISWKSKKLTHASADLLTALLQWSDLVVFDYITGNYDRVASMQDAAEKEGRPDMFVRDTIHNLAVSRSSGASRGIWLIDNESGLLDAYSLMYDDDHDDDDSAGTFSTTSKGHSSSARFVAFHERMLRTFCVFRRSTHDRIVSLLRRPTANDTLDVLLDRVRRDEPLFVTPEVMDAGHHRLFAERFHRRIRNVHDWMNTCRHDM